MAEYSEIVCVEHSTQLERGRSGAHIFSKERKSLSLSVDGGLQ